MKPTNEQVRHHARRFASRETRAYPDERALHAYTDPSGNPLYWRIRLKNAATGEKWIRPFYHDGERFRLGEPPKPKAGKPIYSQHLLAKNPDAVVMVVEGEKPADAFNNAFEGWKADVVATTSGSASSARAADWTPLAGRHVVVWPDNDQPGAQYAEEVCACLRGTAASVTALNVSGLNLPAKGDAVDWLQSNDASLDALIEMLDFSRLPSAQNGTQGGDVIDATPSLRGQSGDLVTPLSKADESAMIQMLAGMSDLDYARAREDHANQLGVGVTALDKAVAQARKETTEIGGMIFADCEPWHEPIEPDALLTEISEAVRRYIVCGRETADAVALWAAMTWFIDVVQVAPLAVITSPEKRCGKSLLLSLLGRICCRPLSSSNISPAALFRSIDAWQPTLLVDEADAFMRENEELRGLLNCGHTRDSAYTVRTVGEAHTPTRFNVWGAKALAGIGRLADTLMDRSITLELRRKTKDETVERLRYAESGLFDKLAAKLARFAKDRCEAVRAARPELPASLHDRAQDNWEPLLAIAQVAGGVWPDRARTAALKLSSSESSEESAGTELLLDIRGIFERENVDRISTAVLINALCKDDEKRWSTLNRGKQMTPQQLAKRLKNFGIASRTIRFDAHYVAKGFERAQFLDAFVRYLPPPSESGDIAVTPLQPNIHNASSVRESAIQRWAAMRAESCKPLQIKDSYGVTDETALSEGDALTGSGLQAQLTGVPAVPRRRLNEPVRERAPRSEIKREIRRRLLNR